MQKPRVNFNYSDDEDNDVTISFRVNDVSIMVAKFNDFLRALGYLEQVGVVNLKPYTDQIIDDSCISTMVDHSILS